ncbi:MAG TPA: hypothetical protein VFT50_18995 [Baekduia sp.]|nr:hypothetical protein [Baekduia sp.]
MADRILLISWGRPITGREQHGLEVFNDAVAFYGELQQAGRIEGFDVAMLDPNAQLDGFMLLHGSREQLNALREDLRFQRLMIDAGLIVDHLTAVEGAIGEGVMAQMPMYEEAVGRVPQMA